MINSELELREFVGQQYNPSDMLIFYRNSNRAYVEHHEINKGVVQEGKPVTRKMLSDMALAAQEQKVLSTATTVNLLPTNVLIYDTRAGKHIIAWYEKPQIRIIKMLDEDTNKTIARPVPMPAVLFVANSEDLSVYAMRTGSGRPSLSTPLFMAPVPNIYADSNVCMGDISCPKGIDDISDLISAWSAKFWSGKFTHSMHKCSKTDLEKLYPKLKKAKIFPAKELIPAKIKNVKSLFRSL